MWTLYYSTLCPDCPPVKEALDEKGIDYTLQNITEDLQALKHFLRLREHAAFSAVKDNGSIGIPAIVSEDETHIYFSLEEFMKANI